jgi:tRNA nucleotidyltransferase/poly(A) polymerase
VVQKLFPRTVPVGVEHGTVGVLTRDGILLEVTTFRRDVETSGRHAVVEFADTLQEDLARRDFTINAVAWHSTREEFQDPFRGREDLEARLLRTVGNPGDRFSEDYLRVLRALRFSGRFGLRIDGETWRALCDSTDQLGILSPERVREELMKVLSQDAKPSGALALYAASGVLGELYPELSSMEGCSRPGRDEDLWAHCLLLTDLLPAGRPALRLTALLHGLGIPEGDGDPGENADVRGRNRAAALMIRRRYSNAQVREVTELIGMGLEPPLKLSDPAGLRRWLHRSNPDRLPSFGRIWLGKARLDQLRWGVDPGPVLDLLRRLRGEILGRAPLRVEELALSGRDLIALGLKPSPQFGEILDELMGRVLEDPSLNTRDRLMELVELAGVRPEESK